MLIGRCHPAASSPHPRINATSWNRNAQSATTNGDFPLTTQPAPVVEDDGATVEASLRRLKALHNDGILTDDEYETKRKALTDQL